MKFALKAPKEFWYAFHRKGGPSKNLEKVYTLIIQPANHQLTELHILRKPRLRSRSWTCIAKATPIQWASFHVAFCLERFGPRAMGSSHPSQRDSGLILRKEVLVEPT